MNIRTMPQRIAVSLVAVVGVAAVVGVFAGVLSMASGFQRTMASSGAEDVAVVLRAGSDGELASGLSAEQVQVIESAPGVLRRDGQPVVSAELYVVVDVEKKSTGLSANVPLRGIQPSGLDVRDNVEIIEGRMFELGKNEFIVGRGAADQFKGLEVGNTIRFGLVEWSIVGMFSDGGGVAESELWSDVRVIQSTYNRGNSFQSARVRLTSPDAITEHPHD